MRLTRLLPIASLLLIGLAACEDAKNQSPAPSAPEPSAAPSPLTASDAPNTAAQLNQQIASVCKAYRKARALAKAALAKTPNDTELQAVVKSYDDIIDDAC